MNSHLKFWAKLGDTTWPNEYHPVVCHRIDVAAVASGLWENVFRRQFRAVGNAMRHIVPRGELPRTKLL